MLASMREPFATRNLATAVYIDVSELQLTNNAIVMHVDLEPCRGVGAYSSYIR